jgi:VCBS repeat-containing protein
VNEDGAADGAGFLTAAGSIPLSDADQGQGSFVPGTLTQGNLGKLTLAANGAYTYAVSAALVQYLAAGQTRIEDFVITSLDGTQKHVDFTIVGANDAPVLKADATTLSGLINERAATTGSSTPDVATGSIAFTDLDLTDAHQVTITGVTTSGTKTGLPSDPSSLLSWMKLAPFTDSTGGVTGNVGWTFSAPDKAFDYLAAGESATLTYAVQVTDGHGGVINQNVTVAVQGANDAPVIQPSSVLTKEIDVAHTISAVGESYLTSGPTLIGNLGSPGGGGASSFGEHELFLAGDRSSGPIDITSVFGSKGIDYFGHYYTSIYINENGNITFSGPNGGYSPPKGDLINTDLIAPFWGNVDLTTSGHIYYDMDPVNGVVTITWYQVGYHNQTSGGSNSFQLQLVDEGNGNFDMVFRYQDINWTNNSGSGNDDTNGTGAFAGYTYQTNSGYTTYVIADRTDQNALLHLDTTAGNTSITGLDVFKVAPNPIQNYLASGTLDFVDPDLTDVHTGTFTAANGTLGQLQLVKVSDTTGTGTGGEFKWVYSADATVVSDYFRATTTTDKLETFDVVIDDGHQQLHQTVTVHLEYGAMA